MAAVRAGRGLFDGDIVLSVDNETCIDGADVIHARMETITLSMRVVQAGRWSRNRGRLHTAEALHRVDKFVVDDIALAKYFDRIGRDRKTEDGQPDPEFPGGMPTLYATIGEIVAGKKHGRDSDDERIIAIPIGMAICDVAVAHLVYHSALDRG
jgi:hypothetical protein